MKILNLVYPEKSDVKYKISKFPDGQQNITILDDLSTLFGIEILSRLNNFQDLELIICAKKSLGCLVVSLKVPYFLGSRSDRKFEEGSINYLKEVICPIINSLNFEFVTVIDPHSDVLEACLNNFVKESNERLIVFAYNEIYKKHHDDGIAFSNTHSKSILISPDSGASKKIFKLAEKIGFKGEIITCSKDRDNNGKLTRCIVPMQPQHTTKDLIIIDDICDGGATFVNISKAIDEYNINYKSKYGKKYLIVTHGIFSKGLDELSKHFDQIYTTDSYKDVKNYTFNGVTTDLVKQLNLFQ